jgi:hypothetical protein
LLWRLVNWCRCAAVPVESDGMAKAEPIASAAGSTEVNFTILKD